MKLLSSIRQLQQLFVQRILQGLIILDSDLLSLHFTVN